VICHLIVFYSAGGAKTIDWISRYKRERERQRRREEQQARNRNERIMIILDRKREKEEKKERTNEWAVLNELVVFFKSKFFLPEKKIMIYRVSPFNYFFLRTLQQICHMSVSFFFFLNLRTCMISNDMYVLYFWSIWWCILMATLHLHLYIYIYKILS
jgi:hypothetical protein